MCVRAKSAKLKGLRLKRGDPMLDGTSDPAKRFLLEKLIEQAQRDQVPFSDIEKRMFLFSETDGNTDWDANRRFDIEYNDTEYETKMAKLLHRSFMHAQSSAHEVGQWQMALETLRDADFYGLVMIDQAKIPRPKPHISVVGKQIAEGFWSLENPRFLAAKIAIVILALALVLDPIHLGWLRADGTKLICIAVAAIALWLVGRVEKHCLLRKVEQKADPTVR